MRRRDQDSQRLVTCASILRKAIRLLLSHVGLTCLVVCYSILGGVAFKYLESPSAQHETDMKRLRASVSMSRERYSNDLWQRTEALNTLNKTQWIDEASRILRDFKDDVIGFTAQGWDGTVDGAEPMWTFARSLLYSVTVITTIGYGDVTPETPSGRLFTMAFALFGVPLMLVCLVNNGKILAGIFRLLYGKANISIVLCNCPLRRTTSTRNGHKSPCGSRLCQRCQRRRTTVDQMVDRTSSEKVRREKRQTIAEEERSYTCDSAAHNAVVKGTSEVTYAPKHSGEDEDQKVIVPVKVSLLLITMYILTGGLIFEIWEQWTYWESSYFCFITLSTIGIGDYVPGTSAQSWESAWKRLVCTLYLLFGLTLMSMCFTLMQDQLKKAAQFISLNTDFRHK